jgi:hypothetical protein
VNFAENKEKNSTGANAQEEVFSAGRQSNLPVTTVLTKLLVFEPFVIPASFFRLIVGLA